MFFSGSKAKCLAVLGTSFGPSDWCLFAYDLRAEGVGTLGPVVREAYHGLENPRHLLDNSALPQTSCGGVEGEAIFASHLQDSRSD